MSAPPPTAETSASEMPPPPSTAPAPRPPISSQLADILGSLHRLAELQLGILLTSLKMAVFRIVLLAMLCLLALLLFTVAVIFLYAGVYHVLTDLLRIPTAWALLIFAGVHLLLAGILALAAIVILKGRHNQKEQTPGGAP
jgi:hypothetical protein